MKSVLPPASPASFFRAFFVALVGALPSAVGCGGGTSAPSDEPTLPQQIDIAELELDPAERARKLLKLSADQRQIKDLPGGTLTTEKAQDAAADVKDPLVRTELLLAVADEFIVLGRTEQAQGAAESAQYSAKPIENADQRLVMNGRITALFHRADDPASAKKMLEAIATDADDTSDPAERVERGAVVAATAVLIGDNSTAEKYYAQIDSYAAKIDDVPKRIKALAVAAGRLYRTGQGAEALKRLNVAVVAARALADPAAKADALLVIFETLQDLRKSVPLAELLPEAKAAADDVADETARTALTARVQTLLSLPE
jgi:hypothetical protein